MAQDEKQVRFQNREFRGSRFRCLLATSLPKPRVTDWLNSLVQPFASVGESDRYMPEGFCRPAEAKLGETAGFLDDNLRNVLAEWWLAVRRNANTPNWDLVSTCSVGQRTGLLLVEAKAHAGELNANDKCGARNQQNLQRISQAIQAANTCLGNGWSLSMEECYQLSNRFAWAWKVASLGVPVVLVYLGFLNAKEMDQAFDKHEDWKNSMLKYARNRVPTCAWNTAIQINCTPLIPLIRSADVNVVIG